MRIGLSLVSQASDRFTGIGTYVREVVRALAVRDDVQLELICNAGNAEAVRADAPPSARVTCADGYGFGSSRFGRVTALAQALLLPVSRGRQLPTDLDLLHYPLTIPVPQTNIPTVVTLHDVQHHDYPDYFTRPQHLWRRLTYDRPGRRASAVITDSEHARARIIERLRIEPENVTAIHLGVDTDRFDPEPGPDDERLLAEAGVDWPFLFYPAALWTHKNHERLFRAFARADLPEIRLVLTGPQFGRLPELERQIATQRLTGRVIHLGVVPSELMPALYRAATGLVFPSLYEGFGTPPLEAMACGCPVASSCAASLAEVCGDAVLRLDPLDGEQMSAAIHRVAGDDEARARLVERGLARARSFTWARAAEAHVGVYRRVAGQ